MATSPIPIQFAPGSWGGIIDGVIADLESAQAYSVTAQAGQSLTMIFDGGGSPDGLSGDPPFARVVDPDGDYVTDHAESGVTIRLPKSGAYQIVVGLGLTEMQWAGTFTLCVLIVNGQRQV